MTTRPTRAAAHFPAHGFVPDEHTLQISGLCVDCAEARDAAEADEDETETETITSEEMYADA